jgi:hypothetical protein
MTSRSTLDLRTLDSAICAYSVRESVRTTERSVVQLLQCYLRAAELETRADKEPLRSDLDVKGTKAQVLGRTEVLEAREREREELLSELAPAIDIRGHERKR